jgi:hypothetical protein
MMIRKHEDGSITYPYSEGQLRRDFKHISFKRHIGNTAFPTLGVYLVTESEKPVYDALTQSLSVSVEGDSNTNLSEVWTIVDLPNDVAVARASEAALEVKNRVKTLLRETDFTELGDASFWLENGSEFRRYRNDLRKILKNPTANPEWPQKPSTEWR